MAFNLNDPAPAGSSSNKPAGSITNRVETWVKTSNTYMPTRSSPAKSHSAPTVEMTHCFCAYCGATNNFPSTYPNPGTISECVGCGKSIGYHYGSVVPHPNHIICCPLCGTQAELPSRANVTCPGCNAGLVDYCESFTRYSKATVKVVAACPECTRRVEVSPTFPDQECTWCHTKLSVGLDAGNIVVKKMVKKRGWF